jgi:hypothetical protein
MPAANSIKIRVQHKKMKKPRLGHLRSNQKKGLTLFGLVKFMNFSN